MMKRLLLIVLCTFSLSVLLHSCGTSNSQNVSSSTNEYQRKQRLKMEYGNILTTYSEKVLVKINSIISPQSGKELRHKLDLNNISVPEDNVLAVNVRYDWIARDWLSGVSYGTCTLTGTLYLYLPNSPVDLTKAEFFPKDYNQHFVDVSTKSNRNKVLNGVVVTQ